MPKILIIAECDAAELKPATRHALSAAQAVGGDIDVLAMGGECAAAPSPAAEA
ncbi:MAG TPA: electron transfer flavoprotein subunit alpha/FixB family protein, partial [Azospirillaceae bacterium]|nr:electron transfer flavoprotein subunit alpha/FixB family protein [Azospirillaceae bacterium]